MPNLFRLTRIAALIVAGATFSPHDAATLQDQVRYAATACRWTDPLTGETRISFALSLPPAPRVDPAVVDRVAAGVRP